MKQIKLIQLWDRYGREHDALPNRLHISIVEWQSILNDMSMFVKQEVHPDGVYSFMGMLIVWAPPGTDPWVERV